MENNKEIRVSIDFTEYPGPRYIVQGEFSGEAFYYEKLNSAFAEAVSEGVKLVVVLDGTAGYASSFLDEAFGNLVYDFELSIVKSHIEIISRDEPHWITMIQEKTYTQWEGRRKDKTKVIISKQQDDQWFNFSKGKITKGFWVENKVMYSKTEQ